MVADISNYQKELDHPRKVLIIIQNINSNDLFKWYFVRYLQPADSNPARIRRVDKFSESIIDFKEIKFLVKFRDFQKIEEKIVSALGCLVMKQRKTSNLSLKTYFQKTC